MGELRPVEQDKNSSDVYGRFGIAAGGAVGSQDMQAEVREPHSEGTEEVSSYELLGEPRAPRLNALDWKLGIGWRHHGTGLGVVFDYTKATSLWQLRSEDPVTQAIFDSNSDINNIAVFGRKSHELTLSATYDLPVLDRRIGLELGAGLAIQKACAPKNGLMACSTKEGEFFTPLGRSFGFSDDAKDAGQIQYARIAPVLDWAVSAAVYRSRPYQTHAADGKGKGFFEIRLGVRGVHTLGNGASTARDNGGDLTFKNNAYTNGVVNFSGTTSRITGGLEIRFGGSTLPRHDFDDDGKKIDPKVARPDLFPGARSQPAPAPEPTAAPAPSGTSTDAAAPEASGE